MASVRSVATAGVLACLLVAGCGGGTDSAADTSPSTTSAGASYDPPAGKVVFDLRVRPGDRHPALDAYAAWQRASTTTLRRRDMSAAVTEHAAEGAVDVVKRSLATVREHDHLVPRRMIGRVESVRASGSAAILRVCLWSPSFDYLRRESGESATAAKSRWLGVEVRMTRPTGQDGGWIVAGLSKRAECEGSRP